MTKLYKGIAFSPPTKLTQPVNTADTEFHIENASALPDAPNYATLGTDEEGETILYAAKAGGLLSGCTRAVEGTAKAWPADTPVARNFTAADYNSAVDRIEEKVDAQEGKGLSSNDYTDAEKEKLAGIENYDDSALAARMTAAEEKNAEQDAALAGKVDAAQGMALYPDSDKAKLAGIAEGANKYTLPAASAEALGGIKLGKGLSIDENGTVSVTGGGGGGMHIFAHAKADTIHSLTGEASEGLFPLLFQATEDYALDDTLTLNGEAYSIRNAWGRPLQARAWTKGAVVSACADPVGKALWFALSSGNTTIIEGGHAGMIDGKNYYNFPLTLQEEEPVPICDGHVWVKMTKERADQIRRVYIDSALRVSQEDGSLVFKVVDNNETYFSVSESKPINVGQADEREITITDLIHPEKRDTTNWQAGLNIGSSEIRKSRPVVYSRLGGVVDVETAYLYDGVTRTWQMISQNGQYLLMGSNWSPNRYLTVYNRDTDETYSPNETFATPQTGFRFGTASPDGRYIFGLTSNVHPYLFGWKREGDIWERMTEEALDPLPEPPTVAGRTIPGSYGLLALSPDGGHLAVLSGPKQITIYKRADAGGYHLLNTIEAALNDVQGANCINCLRYNPSGTALYAGCGSLSLTGRSTTPATGHTLYTQSYVVENPARIIVWKIEADTYTQTYSGDLFYVGGQTADTYKCAGGITDIDFSPDGKNMVVATRGGGYIFSYSSFTSSFSGSRGYPGKTASTTRGNSSSYLLLYRFGADGITPVFASVLHTCPMISVNFQDTNSSASYYYTYAFNTGCFSQCRYSPDGKTIATFATARLDSLNNEEKTGLLSRRDSPFRVFSVDGEVISPKWSVPSDNSELIPIVNYGALSWSADSRYIALNMVGVRIQARIFKVECSESGSYTVSEVLDADGNPPIKQGNGFCAEFIPGVSIQ